MREKVRPACPVVGLSAKKFALRAQNGPKTVFSGVLGEFFRGNAGGGGVPGELFPYTRTVASYHRRRGALHAGNRGGFCTT